MNDIRNKVDHFKIIFYNLLTFIRENDTIINTAHLAGLISEGLTYVHSDWTGMSW